MKVNLLIATIVLSMIVFPGYSQLERMVINNDPQRQIIHFGNNKLKMKLDYHQKCVITAMEVSGNKVIDDASGVFSQIQSNGKTYSTLQTTTSPRVTVTPNSLIVSGIQYGDQVVAVEETWKFIAVGNDIRFTIERKYPRLFVADEIAFPSFHFKSINTWEGAFLGTGGLAWFYLFTGKQFTYGVHSSYAAFWNSKNNNGLKITVYASGKHVASRFTRSNEDQLVYSVTLSDSELLPRYDADTHRRRFVRGKTDVWSSVEVKPEKVVETMVLSPFEYSKQYGRGEFVGIDGKRVEAVLNTIARIGVIDAQHFGGNSWHTPYGPICLHEQYIAQMGLAINDDHYIDSYKQCLDFYRDHAIQPDGRVIARWAYENSDAMAGSVNPQGFYEAQWGYLMDSNPDFVTNVAELYDLCGDAIWVKGQQQACEKALDYMLRRDENKNHLVEMMTDSEAARKGSDWIDIIWASYENAFVNAKLYHALVLWADIEKRLGNTKKGNEYADFAAKLKISFNQSTRNGGFWDEEKQCYIHWCDKDNSLHGTNMVTPVNFMAIAYGICDNRQRAASILDQIETQMQKEKLFFWPICLYSYQKGEGNDWQFPFPNYENGDIFLSWGSVAVAAYAAYKPEIALRYVAQVLKRHSEDGLAFQRYGREKQDGRGDDILAGNSLAVVGLYQAIYGINPKFNRLYLNPHITSQLAGTKLRYRFRGEPLTIALENNHYSVSGKQFSLSANRDFGFMTEANKLFYFNGSDDGWSLQATTDKGSSLHVAILDWNKGQYIWSQQSDNEQNNLMYTLRKLSPNSNFTLEVDGKKRQQVRSDASGVAVIQIIAGKKCQELSVREAR